MTSPTNQSPHRLLPLLLLLFIGSGCAALIYEIVWFQLLELVIGSSAVSLGVLLGTFMGGMCIGSPWLPRIISARWHPLRVYALLEIGIGLMGLAVLWGMPALSAVYVANAKTGSPGLALRAALCAICLLPPTLLMGATLPAISRWVERTPRGVAWLGFFYGGNTVGAVSGCMLAGFYLLRVYDMATATYVAVGINTAVGLLGLILSFFAGKQKRDAIEPHRIARTGSPIVYIVAALSGASALGAEVVWTRLLSLLLGPTVYTFSVILAVFLIGLGGGSILGAMIARLSIRPRAALGMCQFLLAGTIGWTAYALGSSLPFWPIDPSLSHSPYVTIQIDLLRCLFAIAPAAILWGASFPLALAAAAESSQEDQARLVGGVYAANTLGAIVGAIVFSLWLIPAIGTRDSQCVMVWIAVVAAVLAWAVRFSPAIIGGVAAAAAIGIFMPPHLPGVPWELVAYGRYLTTTPISAVPLYVGEGMTSSVVVSQESDGVRNFHVAGKIEASTEPQDMRLQRMLGDLPALIHPHPKTVLVVGCGAGVTAGSFLANPEIEKITICEIEPLVPEKVADYFAAQNYNVVHDPRVKIVFDDARHFVLTSNDRFDIITSDPIHPWVKGAATLYTREYFQICKDHLNPGGIVTQWVPLYQSTEPTVKSEFATFFEVFPSGTIWDNDYNAAGYDTVLMGREGDGQTIDVDEMESRLNRPDHQTLRNSLAEVGFGSSFDLLATYAGRAEDLKNWLADAQINRDNNLRLQYLAGWGMDSLDTGKTYKDMLAGYVYRPEMFIASPNNKLQLDVSMLRARTKRDGQ
jgi:spermidine synthase